MIALHPPKVFQRVPPVVADLVLVGAALLDGFVDHDSSAWRFGLGLFGGVVLLLRRRFPVIVLAATLPAVFLSSIFLAPEIALFSVAASARRWVWPVLGGVGVFVGQLYPFSGYSGPSLWLVQIVYAVLFALAPVFLGLLVQARRALVRQLDELTAGQQREQRLVTDKALAVERAHLAREMHDVVAHNVSLIALQAGALRMTTTDPAAADSANTIRSLSVRTLDELRHMVGVLRAAGANATELSPQPTLTDLAGLVASCGLPVDLRLDPDVLRFCSGQVERAVYRTVQEGLTNVNKHAPGAATTVEVRRRGNGVSVTVSNEPPPAPVSRPPLLPGGHGLIGLRERAALLGGTVQAQPTGEGGYVLSASLPADYQARGHTAQSEGRSGPPAGLGAAVAESVGRGVSRA